MTQLKTHIATEYPPSGAVVADAYRTPIGYEQLTGLSAVKGLTAAAYDGASYAVLQAESQDVRWRDDGTNPTASVGMILLNDPPVPIAYFGDLSAIKFIEETASAKLNVSYYRI